MGGLAALCTLVPDQAQAYTINETEHGRRIRWAEPAVVMQVEPAIAEMLPAGQVRRALEISMDAWRGYDGVPSLEVSTALPGALGHTGKGPTNGIYLPRVWPHEPSKLAITVVTYEMASGRLLDADIVVNPDVAFALIDEDTPVTGVYDLAAVLTHEMGHVLGLGESEDDRMATMWPYADQGDTHQRTLTQDDEDGILDAYDGPPPLPAAACAQMTVGGAGRHATPVWLAFLSVLVLGWLALRTPARARRGAMMAGGVALLAFGGGGGAVQRELRRDAGVAHEHAGVAHAHARMPALARVTMAEPAARARMSRAFTDLSAARIGVVQRHAARKVDGLIYTDLDVVAADGERVRLSLPGGELDGIGQIVGHGRLPADGDELMVDPESKRYAFHAAGSVWGGALGEGPAIELGAHDVHK